jgi:hypothetical protein
MSVHQNRVRGDREPFFASVPAMPKINGLRILTCSTEIILDWFGRYCQSVCR